MKKSLFLTAVAFLCAAFTQAQSVSVYSDGNVLMNYATENIDSIVFNTAEATGTATPAPRKITGKWCALGTSITWYNENVSFAQGRFTRGYQSRVMDKLEFSKYENRAVNGGVLYSAIGMVLPADYYTVEHGVNDWGHGVPVGTMEDYINNTNNGTFAAFYRRLIDAIYEANPNAKVVLITPRKAYGFSGYLPEHWYDKKNGIYLKEYADIIKQIAEYEGIPVADWFNECGGQHNLDKLSIDVALHPNDPGYQMMANVLIQALEKVITE